MTDQQRRALDYLERYHQAQVRAEGLGREVDALRDRAETVRSGLAVDRGWTGKTEKGKHKVYAPLPRPQSEPGNRKQTSALCLLADKSKEHDELIEEVGRLRTETEAEIDRLIEDEVKRTILKLRHIVRVLYAEIGATISYSAAHTRRIHHEALYEFGTKLNWDQG